MVINTKAVLFSSHQNICKVETSPRSQFQSHRQFNRTTVGCACRLVKADQLQQAGLCGRGLGLKGTIQTEGE